MFKKKRLVGGNPFATNTFRVFFYYVGCPYCLLCYGIIDKINSMVKPGKRIAIVNIYSSDYRVKIIQPDVVPFIYLDGFVIKGTTSREYIESFLYGYMKEQGDLIEKKKYY